MYVPCLWELYYRVSLAMRRVVCVKCVEGVLMFVLVYFPWLFGCRSVIRMKNNSLYLPLVAVGGC